MSSTEPKAALVPELYVRDIETSREFYVGMLGFEVLFERPEDGFLYLAREGAELMLDTIDQGRTWLAAPADPPYGRGMSLMIWAQDAAALYAHVKENGGHVFLELEDKWYRCDDTYSGSRQFIVQDPDGYLLRFAEDIGEQRGETPELA
ncbi:MAG: VOC family protein [Rhodospirillaceae bacterium]|nr:VOC family protein [Rhodospirillaceae bacterium]